MGHVFCTITKDITTHNFMERFDGNYTLEILVWATSLYHYEGPEGWEESGIERKPSFTRNRVKDELRAKTGMGFLPPINRGNGSLWYALTEKAASVSSKPAFRD